MSNMTKNRIIELDDASFFDFVTAPGVKLLELYLPGCQPCHKMERVLADLAMKYDEVHFARIDGSKNEMAWQALEMGDLKMAPITIFFYGTKKKKAIVGFASEEMCVSYLDELLLPKTWEDSKMKHRNAEELDMSWLRKLNRLNYREIEPVDIVYEDCARCPANDVCPTVDNMRKDLAAVKFLRAMFRRTKVPVTMHRKDSKTNGKAHTMSLLPGTPLPLVMNICYDGSSVKILATPHYNFFRVRYKNKTERLYTIKLFIDEEKKEGVSCPMYY